MIIKVMFEIIVIIIQMFLKIQERQLTGNARIKKVEILSQAWCDSKWGITITIMLAIHLVITITIALSLAIVLMIGESDRV